MTITEFAAQHRLTARRDKDGTDIITGKLGHFYEYDADELGLIFIPSGEPRLRLWNSIRKQCVAAGFTLRQNGDAEGALTFDPRNRQQARLAIKLAGVRPKRQMSKEQRQAKAAILMTARLNRQRPCQEQGLSA